MFYEKNKKYDSCTQNMIDSYFELAVCDKTQPFFDAVYHEMPDSLFLLDDSHKTNQHCVIFPIHSGIQVIFSCEVKEASFDSAGTIEIKNDFTRSTEDKARQIDKLSNEFYFESYRQSRLAVNNNLSTERFMSLLSYLEDAISVCNAESSKFIKTHSIRERADNCLMLEHTDRDSLASFNVICPAINKSKSSKNACESVSNAAISAFAALLEISGSPSIKDQDFKLINEFVTVSCRKEPLILGGAVWA